MALLYGPGWRGRGEWGGGGAWTPAHGQQGPRGERAAAFSVYSRFGDSCHLSYGSWACRGGALTKAREWRCALRPVPSGIGGAGHRKRSHSARQRPIRQPPPMPPPPPAAAASTAPQVAHRYVKQRRQFGRHPHFTDQGAEVRHAGVDIGTLLRICWHPHIAAPCSPSRRRACLLLVAPTCCSCCWTCGPMKSMPRRG